jgi:hypothetical protein
MTKETADYAAMQQHFKQNNLNYLTFHPKDEKPLKAVICHLSSNMPVKDLYSELQTLGFSIIN